MPNKEELEALLQRHRGRVGWADTLEDRRRRHQSQEINRTFEDRHVAGLAKISEEWDEQLEDLTGRLDWESRVTNGTVCSTGILSLDIALGGGLPVGVTEIYGKESSGKTTLSYEIMRSAQDQGLNIAICSSEALDIERMKRIGVNLDTVAVIQGAPGESVLSAGLDFIQGNDRALFIDSMTGIRPAKDDPGNWLGMVQEWLASVSTIPLSSLVLITNQIRQKRSCLAGQFFAGTTGSTARKIQRYFDTRLELDRDQVTDTTYNMVVNVVANLRSAPHKIVSLPVVKNSGIEVWRDVVRVAVISGVLTERSSYYYYLNSLIGHGEQDTAMKLSTTRLGGEIFEQTTQAIARV